MDQNGKSTETQVSNVLRTGDWKIDDIGVMSLYNFWVKKGDIGFNTYTMEDFKHVVSHEFGHFLGVGDAYKVDNNHKDADDTYKVPDIGYYYSSIMRNNGHANANDIEMLLEAVKKNERRIFTIVLFIQNQRF